MIEFLTNNSWLSPQIDFLLFLQNLRVSHFSMFDNFFLSVTIIGEFWLPLTICAIVYWCIDFKSGIYLFSLSSFNVYFAHLIKMIACVYRPWVLSDKIKPVQKAIALAAGYSFPSGHSSQASAILGGLAFLLRKKVLISILLILYVLLVGFSRMWLGVHTPQDVVVGFLIGFSLVFVTNFIINWAEKNKDRYLYLFSAVNLLIILALIYICYFNTYPSDFVNGELLVNTRHSIQTVVFCYGNISGLLSGLFLCRRFFPFNPKDVSIKRRLIRGIIGATIIIISFKFGVINLFCKECDFKIVYFFSFLEGFFVTAIYPLIFSKMRIKI